MAIDPVDLEIMQADFLFHRALALAARNHISTEHERVVAKLEDTLFAVLDELVRQPERTRQRMLADLTDELQHLFARLDAAASK